MDVLIIIEASGKVKAWNRISGQLGMRASVFATGGHICRFPRALSPLGIDLRAGAVPDAGRIPDPRRAQALREAFDRLPQDAPVLIASDNDIEGDVIACDIAEILLAHAPGAAPRLLRLRPAEITKDGISAALAGAKPVSGAQLARDAVQGRARAITDRWIGAVFSARASLPVGRVRSALLGASFILGRAPALLRARPETGEIIFQSRSAVGGRPFMARLALTGAEDKTKIAAFQALAERYRGRLVPGSVRPLRSLSAAVAHRCGAVQPFNTADALAYAARHHGVGVCAAMRGLQTAYEAGMISYPRTESRELSPASARAVTLLGAASGIGGLDAERLCPLVRLTAGAEDAGPDAHEALHPVLALSPENGSQLRALIRRPFQNPEGPWDEVEVRDLMAALVSRRCFEAASDIRLEPGHWRADNLSQAAPDEAALLEDLDWQRDAGFTLPWTRYTLTGPRAWPADAVLLELMAGEQLGRPSTWAGHVETALESGYFETPEFPAPPRPSPAGMAALKKTPAAILKPATCRMIERHLAEEASGEEDQILASRIRGRVLAWFAQCPKEIQRELAEALKSGTTTAGGASAPAPQSAASAELAAKISLEMIDLDVELRAAPEADPSIC